MGRTGTIRGRSPGTALATRSPDEWTDGVQPIQQCERLPGPVHGEWNYTLRPADRTEHRVVTSPTHTQSDRQDEPCLHEGGSWLSLRRPPDRSARSCCSLACETYPTMSGTWPTKPRSTAATSVAERSSIVTQPPLKTSNQVAPNPALRLGARNRRMPGKDVRTGTAWLTTQDAVRVSCSEPLPARWRFAWSAGSSGLCGPCRGSADGHRCRVRRPGSAIKWLAPLSASSPAYVR